MTTERRYPVAEKFIAPQGEGVRAGVMTAFIRFVGCSVGQKVCTHCDTDFDRTYEHLGGGMFTAKELVNFARGVPNVCLTGGEPLDRDLADLVEILSRGTATNDVQIETSGTRHPDWIDRSNIRARIHLTVCPKPGFSIEMIIRADEIKVIHKGLGDGEGWPTAADAIKWARTGKPVYLQPRNFRHEVDPSTLQEVIQICTSNPLLRVSAQLHKLIGTR